MTQAKSQPVRQPATLSIFFPSRQPSNNQSSILSVNHIFLFFSAIYSYSQPLNYISSVGSLKCHPSVIHLSVIWYLSINQTYVSPHPPSWPDLAFLFNQLFSRQFNLINFFVIHSPFLSSGRPVNHNHFVFSHSAIYHPNIQPSTQPHPPSLHPLNLSVIQICSCPINQSALLNFFLTIQPYSYD